MNDIIKGLQAMQDKYNELTNKLSDKEKKKLSESSEIIGYLRKENKKLRSSTTAQNPFNWDISIRNPYDKYK